MEALEVAFGSDVVSFLTVCYFSAKEAMMATRQLPFLAAATGIWLLISGANLTAQEGEGPAQTPAVPLPIYAANPGLRGPFLIIGRETRISRLPGRNLVDKVARVISGEFERNSRAAIVAKTKDSDSFVAMVLSVVGRHIAD